jgi:hypothetical protein
MASWAADRDLARLTPASCGRDPSNRLLDLLPPLLRRQLDPHLVPSISNEVKSSFGRTSR